MVRAQGGSPDTVRLGTWSIGFYRATSTTRYGTDSGFVGRGYVILAATAADERAAHERIAMQRATGLDVRWVDADEVRRLIPAMAEGRGYRGGSYVATDGWVDPPRNVRAYGLAMQRAGVELRERMAFTGLRTRAGRGGRRSSPASRPRRARSRPAACCSPAARRLQAVARAAGARAWVGYARHQVVVTEPSEALHPETTAMAFDIGAGHLLAARGGRLPLGHVEPRRGTRRRPLDRLAVPAGDGAPAPPPRARHARARHQEGVGRDDRVHARPPAARGTARADATAPRSRARRSRARAATA